MAKVDGLFTGLPSGKIGGVIYSSWNGKGYIKSRPERVHNPKTKAQTQNRDRFKTVIHLISAVSSFVRDGFASRAVGMSAFNAAVSYNFHHATQLSEAGGKVIYPNLMFSVGKYPAPREPQIIKDAAGNLKITWICNTGHARDLVSVVVADETSGETVCYYAIADSHGMQAIMDPPANTAGHLLHAFITISAREYRANASALPSISDSVYAGSVQL